VSGKAQRSSTAAKQCQGWLMGILALLGTWRSEVSCGLANGTRGERKPFERSVARRISQCLPEQDIN
jgi:hypothetical protein